MAKKILVADDDWMFRDLLKFKLSRDGFEITTASNEKELWEQSFHEKPDLILIDFLLKNKMGPGIYDNLLNFGLDPSIPVIFMSSFVDYGMMELQIENKSIYKKLCNFEELRSAIEEALEEPRISSYA